MTHEISLGDFVLSGGELPALALLDAVARLQPGVLTAPSHEQDSFEDGLLEGPHYSRPNSCRSMARTWACRPCCCRATMARSRWRREQALAATARRRPDLIAAARAAGQLSAIRREVSLHPWGSDPRAIIKGFSILCRGLPQWVSLQTPTTARTHTTINPPWARSSRRKLVEHHRHARAGRDRSPEPHHPGIFAPGDTVIVNVNVVEGTRKRVQAYEGVVIAKRNRGLNSSFIVRKISSGEGVERTFQSYSPLIASVEVKRRGAVRRAKLYYLRQRSGKSARIKEKLA